MGQVYGHHVAAGAVIAIPSGTPHWLRDVNSTIEFFAVKVR
jgi:quercetin dioxygenase-like cupin family protein